MKKTLARHAGDAGISRFLPLLLIAASAVVLAGCGGAGGAAGSDGNGRASLTIIWPDRDRLIPRGTNAITAVFKRGQEVIASQTVPRPISGNQSNVTFPKLKPGSLTLTATAYPNANATGIAQATGGVGVEIVADQIAPVTLTMDSTIDNVALTPQNPSVLYAQTLDFVLTAKDAAGSVVLVHPNALQWTSSNTAYATFDANGRVTGVLPTGATPGPLQVSVLDTESGKSAATTLTVTSLTTVTVSPSAPAVPIGDPKQFTATVTNAPNTTVTWSMVEGAAGGSITTGGLYTAPSVVGIYHVKAVSSFDNSKSDMTTVSVESGNAIVIIQ